MPDEELAKLMKKKHYFDPREKKTFDQDLKTAEARQHLNYKQRLQNQSDLEQLEILAI